MQSKYGSCSRCDTPLVPIWFTEEETEITNGSMYNTGRKRKACSHLTCISCFKNECVDDTFDGNWY